MLTQQLDKFITLNNDDYNTPIVSCYIAQYDEYPSYYYTKNYYDWKGVTDFIFKKYNIDEKNIPAYRVKNSHGEIEYDQFTCLLKDKLMLAFVNVSGVKSESLPGDRYWEFNEEDSELDLAVNCRKLSFAFAYNHKSVSFDEILTLEQELKPFLLKPAKKGQINIVTNNREEGFTLKEFKVKKTEMDLALNYGEAFLETHNLIYKSLSNIEQTKGLVLLYGNPGTGKSYYIRNLINSIDSKKIIYLTPDLASMISDPTFITFLLDHPNSILVIEDGENIIRSREFGANQAVANLLNLADGLLADALNLQVICTFNCDIKDVDDALLRKGRLIAKHAFLPLSKQDAQKLSDSLGFTTNIEKEMVLTDIYNQHDRDFSEKLQKQNKIGFGN